MKKILLLLFLFCSVVVSSQVAVMGGGVPEGGSTYTDEYQALLDEWTTDPTGDTLTWQNDLCYSLDTADLFDRLKQLIISAITNNDDGEALVNWANPGTDDATEVNSPTWTKNQGYTGDGSTSYLSGINPNGNVTINSATGGIYIRNNLQSDNEVYGIDDSDDFYLRIRNVGNQARAKINTGNTQLLASITDATGFWMSTRRAVDDVEVYRNGASVDVETDASTGVPNGNLFILGVNDDPVRYTSYQFSVFFVMDSITDAEATSFNTIIETYLDNLGVGVQ